MYVSRRHISLDLEELRGQTTQDFRTPFPHQIEAFEHLNKTFAPQRPQAGSGILVLPTGAGKTFTAVRWLCDHVLAKNIKVLWLAPSFYLLDQACAEFYRSAAKIPAPKTTLNIRCVSSNPSHARASDICTTDDVVIMTTPTAISNLHVNAVDEVGQPLQSAFNKFIASNQDTPFFVVIDEAHHAPAYGCRNLLIGEKPDKLGLRILMPQARFLGLTATPTYTDPTRRGWLSEIFRDGIIYKADKAKLIIQKVLARPNYIERPTGRELDVDDTLYDRLARQHKDLPEPIIESLANDNNRNNLIVDTYVANRNQYGKTIIFADRWFQCVYLKQKLEERGVRADAIYSKIDADPGSADARNKRTSTDNDRILRQFKTGLDAAGNPAPLDVLINVRMLTEGADVPDVDTVFITRQTTSTILLTQMIGRALRGEKAGGSDEANIVLFFDHWKRLIDWADPLEGGTEDRQSAVKGHYPLEYISVHLIEEVAKSIERGGSYQIPLFTRIFPVGWFKTDIAYADSSEDSIEGFTEFIMAYEHNRHKFDAFIDFIATHKASLPEAWAQEDLEESWMQQQVEPWCYQYFTPEEDDIGGRLSSDLAKLVRHIIQNGVKPDYHSFEDRDLYDLDQIARNISHLSMRDAQTYLENEFTKPGLLWKTFYKDLNRFRAAAQNVANSLLDRERYGDMPLPELVNQEPRSRSELTEVEKEQVKQRDGYTCLCCGAKKSRTVRLQIDHIQALKMGGETSLDNSQTLCSTCNLFVGVNTFNFRGNRSPIPQAKDLTTSITQFTSISQREKDSTRSITRIVNWFYQCNAVYKVNAHTRSNGRYYSIWEIHLYAGNDPNWLNQQKKRLLHFIQHALGCHQVKDIQVIAPK